LKDLPSDIIYYILNLLGLLEKHVFSFVCKSLHFTIQYIFVLKKRHFDLHDAGKARMSSELCSDDSRKATTSSGLRPDDPCSLAALNGYKKILKWARERPAVLGMRIHVL
jgi:hypothetical protein